jgi:hypothetical protein
MKQEQLLSRGSNISARKDNLKPRRSPQTVQSGRSEDARPTICQKGVSPKLA